MKRILTCMASATLAVSLAIGIPASTASAAPVVAPKQVQPAAPVNTTLRPGQRGTAVKNLQTKLFRLGYRLTMPSGLYDKTTQDSVKRIQRAYRFTPVHGVATPATMQLIDKAVHAKLSKKVPAGIYNPGMVGQNVLLLQKKLTTLNHLPQTANTGWYDVRTMQAVASYQRAVGLPRTGKVDARTNRSIEIMMSRPRKAPSKATSTLDKRCLTGRAICVDKTGRKVHWVVNGRILKSLDARFAKPGYSTPNGAYKVQRKIYVDYSRRYDNAKMPFSIYYQGGRAVHYSYGFAAQGFRGGSHGCVNLRDWNGAKWLYSQARIGDKVIIYTR